MFRPQCNPRSYVPFPPSIYGDISPSSVNFSRSEPRCSFLAVIRNVVMGVSVSPNTCSSILFCSIKHSHLERAAPSRCDEELHQVF
ncbi:hypothetical protein JTE90_001123 [Oedothorax gibbosus]|uniref:Uncharacterized protein n=1 Tax=Oedothorax gibbosus TaxID=931172 RepID=A0AAV6VGH4_9ARAC|nr:hypothetical protein JTE90_001123 [Oedothorax gibbosus]